MNANSFQCTHPDLAKQTRVELHEPKGSQGWRVEIFFPKKNQFVPLNCCPWAKQAHIFLQCDSRDYLLYEFWSDNETAILETANFLERYFLSISNTKDDWFFNTSPELMPYVHDTKEHNDWTVVDIGI